MNGQPSRCGAHRRHVATAVGGRERHCVSVRAWQSQTLSRTVNTDASTLLVLAALLLLGATR